MKRKSFSLTAGVIFLVLALVHLLRAVMTWDAVIAGWPVPIWLSWLIVLLGGYLASQGLRLYRES